MTRVCVRGMSLLARETLFVEGCTPARRGDPMSVRVENGRAIGRPW
jgi:hypothetical protein